LNAGRNYRVQTLKNPLDAKVETLRPELSYREMLSSRRVEILAVALFAMIAKNFAGHGRGNLGAATTEDPNTALLS